jgi:hypothetical protein
LFRPISGARELPVWGIASHRARGPGAAAALFAVREDGRGGCGSGGTQAAGIPKNPH